jgi:hypothetical protein
MEEETHITNWILLLQLAQRKATRTLNNIMSNITNKLIIKDW